MSENPKPLPDRKREKNIRQSCQAHVLINSEMRHSSFRRTSCY